MIDELVHLTGARRVGDGWLGRCLAHDDHRPSFSFTERDGKYLFRCHTGCSFAQIREALEARGLKLPKKDEGWETVYTIRDTEGNAVAQHVRVDKLSGKEVWWRGPKGERRTLAALGLKLRDLPLYRTEALRDAPANKSVVVTEGEKAAEALAGLGILALGTVTGAATTPSDKPLKALGDRKVYLWPDNDDDGQKHMAAVAAALTRLKVRHKVIAWADAPRHGDAADFVAMGGTFEGVRAMTDTEGPRLRQLWEGAREAAEELDRYQRGDFSGRIQTGIDLLDRKLRGGLRPGEVLLFGAATGGGKTSLAQQIASNAARSGPVLFVSPEMALSALAEREIVRESGREVWDRNPWVAEPYRAASAKQEHDAAAEAMEAEKRPFYVLDRTTSMDEVAEAARAIDGLRLIVIDYAQVVAGEATDEPRYLQVGEVASKSTDLGLELRVPVIVTSQVNVEQRGKKRFYSFRESAKLEHSAHAVVVLDVEMREAPSGNLIPDKSRLICTKNRTGPTFRLEVTYEPWLCRVTADDTPTEEPAEAPAGATAAAPVPEEERSRQQTNMSFG